VTDDSPQELRKLRRDAHSHSRPEQVTVRHLDLDLDVDFAQRRLTGSVRLELGRVDPGAAELVLDTWQLDIEAVTLDDGRAVRFALGEHDPILGRPLTVSVAGADAVTVRYRTHPEAPALQWLEPTQTTSGEPFLFTQSQAISARSWVPVPDTPSVRFTYGATVRVPPGLLALMSAENPTRREDDGVYRFEMAQPVPAYLMALAVGDLEFRSLGPRTGVYAEPTVVEAAAWEFADTEQMVAAAERLFGRYRWDRYDLLVAPPSFPFGGMENPRLSFLTPTLLAGDRSLVSVVAHELAHSWSGNLVTNATWDDFWLNEGFTVYIESRLVEELYGQQHAAMLSELSHGELLGDLAVVPERDQWLELDLAGRHPDEGITHVPYDKGAFFLSTIERAVGRERFDAFLAAYFDRFAFGSMDTPTFLEHLRTALLEPAGLTPDDLDVEAWMRGPGLPGNAPITRSEAFRLVDEQATALVAGGSPEDLKTDGWTTYEWIHLLRALPSDLRAGAIRDLDDRFDFSRSRNSEVLHEWLQYAVDSGYIFSSQRVADALADFLTRQGRRKYLMPLYTKLSRTPQGREVARALRAAAGPGYHAAARRAVDRILDQTGTSSTAPTA
jgi:aminopeptidase N